MLQRDIPFCEVRELSDSGCPIVHLDETWVNAHHTVTSKWYDYSVNPGRDAVQAEVLTGKGKRLIILYAGYEGDFLPDCSLVLVGKTNSIDYHAEMNGDHFAE